MPITTDQCVAALRDLLANRPDDFDTDAGRDWFSDIAGTVSAHSVPLAMQLRAVLPQATGHSITRDVARTQFLAEARAIYTQLRLQTNAFQTAQVAAGAVHDYFEEVRQLVNGAAREVLFIDPHLDGTFVDRYLPQVPAGVSVRLLTSRGRSNALAAAVAMFTQQHGTQVEVRAVPNQTLHDRHLVIDGRDVYQSGASFKDGARNAPTSINQIVDVANDLIRAHEGVWNGAQIVP